MIFGQLISNCFFSRAGSILVLGASGGHDVASGASIPKGTEQKFIEILDSVIGKQVGKGQHVEKQAGKPV